MDRKKKELLKAIELKTVDVFTVGGDSLVTTAKELTPVITGNLKKSIQKRIEKEENLIRLLFGSDVEYAPFVELGIGQYERRMLRDSFDFHKAEIKNFLKEEIRKTIKEQLR